MSENSEAPIPEATTNKGFKERVRGFFKRLPHNPHSESNTVATALPSPEPNIVPTPEQTYKPQEAPDDSVPQTPTDILEEETAQTSPDISNILPEPERELKRAHNIFFHTTPSRNVPSIINNGLYARANHDMLGRGLMYSLTFKEEFNHTNVRRPTIALEGPVDEFSMTIWKNSPDIVKVKNFDGTRAQGEFTASKELSDQENIPIQFRESGGSFMGVLPDDKDETRKVDPTNFLGSIPLDNETQTFLTKCQIEFHKSLATADNVESDLIEFLSRPDRKLTLAEGYSVQDLAHDVMARIEQEVILYSTANAAKKASEYLAVDGIEKNKYSVKAIAENLADVYQKAASANEPVSARYLQSVIRNLESQIEKHPGLQEAIEQAKNDEPFKVQLYGGYNLWGGNEGYALYHQTLKEMGIDPLLHGDL